MGGLSQTDDIDGLLILGYLIASVTAVVSVSGVLVGLGYFFEMSLSVADEVHMVMDGYLGGAPEAGSSVVTDPHIPDAHNAGAPAGFTDEEVFDNIVDFESFFKRLLPTLVMLFLIQWLFLSIVFRAIGLPMSGIIGAFASGGVCAALTQSKKKQFAKVWGVSTLTLSPAGAEVRHGEVRAQLSWSQVERISRSSGMDPLRAGGFHPVGLAVGALAAGTARRKEMALLGVGRISVDPGASALVKSQVKQNFGSDLERAQTGVILTHFDRDWEYGRIGQWIRAYRPDLMSKAAPSTHAAARRETSGETRSFRSWWRRYTDSLN